MSYEKRHYRKKLTSQGLLYLAGQELKITLSNISITGLLAELEANETFKDIEALFKSVRLSPIVDVYLPEMRLVGEVEIVRADLIDGHIYLAMDFTNIIHDIDNPLYERQTYRKNLTAPGLIILNGEHYHFHTVNVSVDGLMIRLNDRVEVDEGTVATFDFKRLDLLGEVKVIWVDHQEAGTLMGLQYNYLEKTFVSGVPRFARQQTV